MLPLPIPSNLHTYSTILWKIAMLNPRESLKIHSSCLGILISLSSLWLMWLSRRPRLVQLRLIPLRAICVISCKGSRSKFALLLCEKIHQFAVISSQDSTNVVNYCFVLTYPVWSREISIASRFAVVCLVELGKEWHTRPWRVPLPIRLRGDAHKFFQSGLSHSGSNFCQSVERYSGYALFRSPDYNLLKKGSVSMSLCMMNNTLSRSYGRHYDLPCRSARVSSRIKKMPIECAEILERNI